MRLETETWYVVGCPESNVYMHWKGDCVSGCYADSGSVDDAERFDTRAAARKYLKEDEDAKRYFASRQGIGIRVCRITRRTRAD